MARLARVIAVGHPHHVIQRGNRCQKVFFNETDKKKYLEILNLQAKLSELEVWAYCLMDNYVHLIVTPRVPGVPGTHDWTLIRIKLIAFKKSMH